ncbi:MAG TPA: hypothetical protein VF335_01515 [Chitinivibrionales bacterium]
MAVQPAQAPKKTSHGFFIVSLCVFVASAALFLFFLKLDRTIEKTSGKVVETFTKKTFASKKQTYDQEYFVVSYSIGGKDYSVKTPHRSGFGQEYAPVYYYKAFPGFAWCYTKANANVVYCSIVMFLALIITGWAWSKIAKAGKVPQSARLKKKP